MEEGFISESDQALLLRYQRAHVEYHDAVLTDNEDGQYEWEFTNAFWALGEQLEDPILRCLAEEANAPGRKALSARQELLDVSYRLNNLFPLQSHGVN